MIRSSFNRKPRRSLKTAQRTVSTEEKSLWDRMAKQVGCIACWLDGRFNDYCSIHPADGRTKPGCHKKVFPLCAPHHQKDDTDPLARIAIHGDKARFEAKYGTQEELIALVMLMLEAG